MAKEKTGPDIKGEWTPETILDIERGILIFPTMDRVGSKPLAPEKELTVTEFARMGGKARAARYSKRQLRRWAKQGGRPHKLTSKSLARLRQMLAAGKAHSEISKRLGVSLRTIGRYVAKQGELRAPAGSA